ncbi:MAG: hypothetical protein JSS89_04745 [Bacteroidetes bacterium]|nr:hypothetical protein [Bacteroidota bacterium]
MTDQLYQAGRTSVAMSFDSNDVDSASEQKAQFWRATALPEQRRFASSMLN